MSTQRRHTAHKHTLAFWIMWRARWMTPSAFIWSRRCRNIQLSNWCECSVCDWVDGIRKRFSICCCRIACAIAVLPHLPVFALTKHRRQIALQTSNFKRNDGVTFSGWMRDRFFRLARNCVAIGWAERSDMEILVLLQERRRHTHTSARVANNKMCDSLQWHMCLVLHGHDVVWVCSHHAILSV